MLPAQPPQEPRVQSPEIHDDRRVTLRLRAPNAKEVTVSGDFVPKPQPLVRDENGVWSITVGPLEPDVYGYAYRLDGTALNDPHNPLLKPGISGTQSTFIIKGDKPLPWDEADVPHGTVHRHFYRSQAIGDARSFVVYTPPGYNSSSGPRYPVLYLLHGAGDLSTSWIDVGRANFVLDNVIASGKAKPMIVVMPFGHAVTRRDPGARTRNTELVAKDLLDGIVPAVEKAYRIAPSSANRAIAGLSMGGGQALWTGLNNTDKFAYVAGFSSAVPEAADVPNAAENAKKLKMLWIAIGKDDFLLDRNTKFEAWLKSENIAHKYQVTDGAHTWRVWRRYLAELTPLLFR
jgi:enterochelin esterase family protein